MDAVRLVLGIRRSARAAQHAGPAAPPGGTQRGGSKVGGRRACVRHGVRRPLVSPKGIPAAVLRSLVRDRALASSQSPLPLHFPFFPSFYPCLLTSDVVIVTRLLQPGLPGVLQ